MRVLPVQAAGSPPPDSKTKLPPVIRRAEVVAFALVALLAICVVVVLYVAKAFFLPVVTAFVVGTCCLQPPDCSSGIEFPVRCRRS